MVKVLFMSIVILGMGISPIKATSQQEDKPQGTYHQHPPKSINTSPYADQRILCAGANTEGLPGGRFDTPRTPVDSSYPKGATPILTALGVEVLKS